jgi:nitroreductase
VVAPYRNGLPAVLEHRVGQGTVVVLTTPASQAAGDPDAWNTLATGFEPWPFVMLANETLLHALDTAAERNIAAGAAAVLHLDRRDLATAFVRTPGGDDFPVAVDQERGTVTVTATQQPGNYTLRAGGGDEGVTSGFSANLDADAIDFTRLADGDLAAALGPDTPVARTEAELVRDVKLERVGSELFGWVILLAAAAMAGDWIVANRFYAPREDAGAGSAAAAFAGAAAGGPDRGVGPPAPEPVPPPVPAAAPAQPPGPPPRRPGPPPVPPPLPEVPA